MSLVGILLISLYMAFILTVMTHGDYSFQTNWHLYFVCEHPVCLVFLSSQLLMCFDISLFNCLELLCEDWQFDSSCDWLPAENE